MKDRATDTLPPPLRVHRAGETSVLAEYPDTAAVLAAAAAVRALSPAHLLELVPAERTLLLHGAAPRDVRELADLLSQLPRSAREDSDGGEASIGIVYDGEDLEEVAELLGMSKDVLISAHSGATWTVAFGGFAPGFPYLVAGDPHEASGPPWEVPRRAEPRTSVPAGAVGLASRYCGIYPRPSPGGWQLIGRSDAPLFDVHREPPALLSPGTRVRFTPQRAASRPTAATAAALARAAREAAAVPARLGLHRGAGPGTSSRPALEILSPGPLALIEDAGRPGRASIGVSRSGAFDRGALQRANRAVGNPSGAAALEILLGPLALRAAAPTVVAVSGAQAPVRIGRGDDEVGDVELPADASRERALALDPGDRIEVGPAADGLRLVLAVRGGITQVRRQDPADDELLEVLGARSRDTLSDLGPDPLQAGDLLLVGPERGLDAVPAAGDAVPPSSAEHPDEDTIRIAVLIGPRAELLGDEAVEALLGTDWTVRQESDRVGVRLDGPVLPVPSGAATVPSEPMLPGAVQVPPSGLPVVFGPDHPTTGGYPVIAVVTREGLDRLAQAGPGTRLRFVTTDGDGTRWSPPARR
ncbi:MULTISPECIES: carboxyltransferase domain-containing protein [Brachybacterium]|uniref:Allophanate hydrolase n=4 Tax=Brachybacterium TaxID=43668 RepID=A0A3R8QM44_9MICO|nr:MULTISPECIES: carboxyltransferase domain-containing protein [Brachybacterium]RRR17683.1 allophanate hydrolase [Brachybacterium paraconglomeratum]GLI29932.1 allophanate hydrolase [Brachybacterium conglomeratum]GLK05891.1 allophanate hydrolase [Brachybacterium conglomeratum]